MAINFPDSPSVDEIYSVGDKSWLWNGTYWEVQGAPSSTFSASDTAPADPDAGDIWYRSDTSQTLLFYDNTWVEIGHSANVPTFFADNDADTKIQVEESADEDTIRFDTAGSERVTIGPSGDVVVYETLTVNGGASVGGSIIPTGNETLDLGSAEYRFRDLYLSGSSIDLGGATISSDGTSIAMPPISNIEGDLTVGTDVLHVDHATSSVGIGTTSPDSLLEIKSSRSELKISSSEVDPLTNHSGRILFENTNTGDTYAAAAIEIHGSTDAARNGSITFLTNPDGLGSPNGLVEQMIIDQSGNVGIGTTSPENVLHVLQSGFSPSTNDNASIQVGGNWGGGVVFAENENRTMIYSPSGNAFRVRVGATASGGGTEALNIDSSGNVGIGTTSPDFQFQVESGTRFVSIDSTSNEAIRLVADDATGRPYIAFYNQDNTGSLVRKGYIGYATPAQTQANSIFYFNAGDGSSDLYISAAAVGINDSTPSYTLDVAGNGRFTTTLHVNDQMYVGANGGGDSYIHFYDDNSNTWRTFGWDDSANEFYGEGGLRLTGVLDLEGTSAHISFADVADIAMQWGDYNLYWNPTYKYIQARQNSTQRIVLAVQEGWVYASRFYQTGGGSTYNWSDERLKRNITDYSGGLSVLRQLRPVEYNWDCDMIDDGTKREIGLIAQEVQPVHPEWVDIYSKEPHVRTSDGEVVEDVLALGFGNDFNVMVISALQELADRVEALEAV